MSMTPPCTKWAGVLEQGGVRFGASLSSFVAGLIIPCALMAQQPQDWAADFQSELMYVPGGQEFDVRWATIGILDVNLNIVPLSAGYDYYVFVTRKDEGPCWCENSITSDAPYHGLDWVDVTVFDEGLGNMELWTESAGGFVQFGYQNVFSSGTFLNVCVLFNGKTYPAYARSAIYSRTDVWGLSPDLVDGAGDLSMSSNWDPQGDCVVSIADAVKLTAPFTTGSYQIWADFQTPWWVVDVGDASWVTSYVMSGRYCSRFTEFEPQPSPW